MLKQLNFKFFVFMYYRGGGARRVGKKIVKLFWPWNEKHCNIWLWIVRLNEPYLQGEVWPMIVLHPVAFLEGTWDACVRSGGSQSSEKTEDRSSPINLCSKSRECIDFRDTEACSANMQLEPSYDRSKWNCALKKQSNQQALKPYGKGVQSLSIAIRQLTTAHRQGQGNFKGEQVASKNATGWRTIISQTSPYR